MEEIKLLPCPFCGKEPNKRKQIVDHDTMFKVSCEYINCSALPETILQPTEEFAAQAWNNRVPILSVEEIRGLIFGFNSTGLDPAERIHNAMKEGKIGR